MNAHISDKDPLNAVQIAFRENAKKVQRNALIAGAKAICKVILDKAQNDKLSDKEKLDDIIQFCEINISSDGF